MTPRLRTAVVGGREIGQLVKHLVHKHEGMSLIHKTGVENPGAVILVLERQRQADPWGLMTRRESLHGWLSPGKQKMLFQRTSRMAPERGHRGGLLTCTHKRTCTHPVLCYILIIRFELRKFQGGM